MNELEIFTVATAVLGSPVIKVGFILTTVLFVFSIPSHIGDHLKKLEDENFSGGKMNDTKFQNRLETWRLMWALSYFLFRILPAILGFALLSAYSR